ncbi:Kinesin light chain 5, partial [Colletotrichum plurivorum]
MGYTAALYVFIFLLSVAILYDQLTKKIPSRLDFKKAPKSRFGIVPVFTDGSPTRGGGIDIIFVHGLGSNPDTTWTAAADPSDKAVLGSERIVDWISDFLLDDLKAKDRNIRMFFYNYDSYWKKDAVQLRLETLGNELLEHLHGWIHISETALVQAYRGRKFSYITQSTKAILFLGTPHHGTSFGKWGWMFAQVLRPLGSNPSILADLGGDAFPLLDLHEHFVNTTRDGLHIFNFYEQRPTPLFRLWFFRWQEFRSATYAAKNVRNIGLSVDHYGLNKFGSKSDSYETVRSKLWEISQQLTKPAKHHYFVPLERVDTYTERVKLSKDLEEKLRIRHEKASIPHAVVLYGLGGTGKSQLALDYAQKQRNRYNPILWLDATDKETMRSSFQKCAIELQVRDERSENEESIFENSAVQAVNRWLHDRTEADDEWLVIVDNADDISWGVRKIIPKGRRGTIIITSQDNRSIQLLDKGYEQIHVEVMSPTEGATLLLKHLDLDAVSASVEIRSCCDEVIQKLGHLALAIDLAGAFIGSNITPHLALSQYLADYDRHHSKLLKMDAFRGLRPTEKTVSTVWNATLEKIRRQHPFERPELLLQFLAHFHGAIVQEEMFRLASLGMPIVKAKIGEVDGLSHELEQFILLKNGEWDSFQYRIGRDVLLRYNLLQQVEGDQKVDWAGVTMHNLVRWRAKQDDKGQPWLWWYKYFVLAACCQLISEDVSEFRRHLIVHLQNVDEGSSAGSESLGFEKLLQETFSRVFLAEGRWKESEGRWKEAQELFTRGMEMNQRVVGEEHPDTLTSMANLTSTYRNQGRWKEAEELEVRVMETRKRVLGEEHPDTLTSMANLASTFWNQGRWKEAEELEVRVMETRKRVLGEEHSDTLTSMANLASTYSNQGRWKEAEELEVDVMETLKTKLGEEHPSTLTSMANLASTYRNQGRWKEVEELFVRVMETSLRVLGEEHPSTLTSMSNLASTYSNQGRWKEAEELEVRVMETRKRVLGADHPSTLSSMGNLALTYMNQGRWKEAEELQAKELSICSTVLGEEHPDTLTSMANLASTYSNQGRWKEAEELEVRV